MPKSTIERVEKRVLRFLKENRGVRYSPLDLVRGVNARFADEKMNPADIKIAALNLVSRGHVLIDQAWTVGVRERKRGK